MLRITTLVLTLCAFTPIAYAEPVTRVMGACVSEDLLDELMTYARKSDMRSFQQLIISGQCAILKPGMNVSVISPGFMVATIRHNGKKLYTPSEAIR